MLLLGEDGEDVAIIVARVISQKLSETIGHQVGADNRPGASTMIGGEEP